MSRVRWNRGMLLGGGALGAIAAAVFAVASAGAWPGAWAAAGPGDTPQDDAPVVSTAPDATWPTYHGSFSLDGVARTRVPDGLVRLWRFKAGERVEETPVVGGGAVYFTNAEGTLFAITLKGALRWKISVGDDGFSSPPVYVDGNLIVGGGDGHLYAYEAETGKPRWKYDIEGAIIGSANRVELAPASADGKAAKIGVIVTSQADGSIHCVDFASGKRLWKTEQTDRCDGSVSVAGDRIAMGSCAAALHVFSVKEARKVADIPLGDECQVAGGVAMSGDVAFAGTRKGKVFAVNIAERKVLWENGDTQRETFTTPAVDARYVLFGSDDRHLYCVDRKTGKQVWKFDSDDVPLSPVIATDRVVFTSGGSLFVLDLKSGKKIWSTEVSDELTSPAVVSGMILVGADDGTVSAFGAKP